jgi:N-acetyl-alpha-D-glucosaminyl L-malate synthase BshA
VIPNFVKLSEYGPPEKRDHDGIAPAGHKLLTHISNFREVKRVKDVVRIFARVRRAMPATLLMIGDGPERADAERESRELAVDGDVRFLGRIDTVATLLQQSDLFLLPSQSESFGLAALEAMACGVPVVGSRVGGLPELIQDGVTGLLEPPGSVEAMARRALELLRDPARHRAMMAAVAERARQFSADAIVPKYEALYQAVAG